MCVCACAQATGRTCHSCSTHVGVFFLISWFFSHCVLMNLPCYSFLRNSNWNTCHQPQVSLSLIAHVETHQIAVCVVCLSSWLQSTACSVHVWNMQPGSSVHLHWPMLPEICSHGADWQATLDPWLFCAGPVPPCHCPPPLLTEWAALWRPPCPVGRVDGSAIWVHFPRTGSRKSLSRSFGPCCDRFTEVEVKVTCLSAAYLTVRRLYMNEYLQIWGVCTPRRKLLLVLTQERRSVCLVVWWVLGVCLIKDLKCEVMFM